MKIITKKKADEILKRITANEIIGIEYMDDIEAKTKFSENNADIAFEIGGIKGMTKVQNTLKGCIRMNKAFEKILDRLDEEREYSYADFDKYVNNCSPCLDSEYDDFFHRGLERSIKVIKEVSEEYKDGWIPVSEMLPEEKDGVVLICEQNGEVETGRYSEFSNQWYKGDMCGIGGSEVIAWQPLPEPFKESD